MNVCFLLLVCFSTFVSGKFHITNPAQRLEVPAGENVTLQCQVLPEIDLDKYTWDVKRVSANSSDPRSVVYSRRHGKDHPVPQVEQYQNRVCLIHEDLRRGAVTVVIHSVRQSDSGQYRCYIPKLNVASVFALVVKDKQNWTKEDFCTVAPPVEGGDAGAVKDVRHHYVFMATAVSITVVAAIALVNKRMCEMFKRTCEMDTLRTKATEEPSAVGVGDSQDELSTRSGFTQTC